MEESPVGLIPLSRVFVLSPAFPSPFPSLSFPVSLSVPLPALSIPACPFALLVVSTSCFSPLLLAFACNAVHRSFLSSAAPRRSRERVVDRKRQIVSSSRRRHDEKKEKGGEVPFSRFPRGQGELERGVVATGRCSYNEPDVQESLRQVDHGPQARTSIRVRSSRATYLWRCPTFLRSECAFIPIKPRLNVCLCQFSIAPYARFEGSPTSSQEWPAPCLSSRLGLRNLMIFVFSCEKATCRQIQVTPCKAARRCHGGWRRMRAQERKGTKL